MAIEVIEYTKTILQSSGSQTPNTLNNVVVAAPQPVPLGYKWLITACTVITQSPTGQLIGTPSFALYDGDPARNSVPINTTIAGVYDTDNSGELLIEGGDQLFAEWFAVPKFAICRARVQYKKIIITDAARVFGEY